MSRRWLGLGLAVGLAAGVLAVAPAGVVGQAALLITLSFDDGQSTPSVLTGVSEGGGGPDGAGGGGGFGGDVGGGDGDRECGAFHHSDPGGGYGDGDG